MLQDQWYAVSKYSKTFAIKKSWWKMRETLKVEPSNSRWLLLKVILHFSAVTLQGILNMYWWEGKKRDHLIFFERNFPLRGEEKQKSSPNKFIHQHKDWNTKLRLWGKKNCTAVKYLVKIKCSKSPPSFPFSRLAKS